MISQLLVSEPAPLCAIPDSSSGGSAELKTLLTLCDLLNRELLVMIGWAKNIPGSELCSKLGSKPVLNFPEN